MGRRGGVCSRSPRARARGFYAGEIAGEDRNPVGHRERIEAPCASWGTVTWRLAGLRHANAGLTLVGMVGGVAFVPAVPGLAPGAFMWERSQGRIAILLGTGSA